MEFTRRDFAKLALMAVPATALFERSLLGATAVQAKPNSKFAGVQIGTITYSYRSMPDQSAEATLKYLVDSGISACELMGGPVDAWAREKSGFQPSAGRAAGGGAARAGGGAGAARRVARRRRRRRPGRQPVPGTDSRARLLVARAPLSLQPRLRRGAPRQRPRPAEAVAAARPPRRRNRSRRLRNSASGARASRCRSSRT